MSIPLQRLMGGHDLQATEMQQAMRVIMQGQATPAQIGAFLTALSLKGETVEELARRCDRDAGVCGTHCCGCTGGADGHLWYRWRRGRACSMSLR